MLFPKTFLQKKNRNFSMWFQIVKGGVLLTSILLWVGRLLQRDTMILSFPSMTLLSWILFLLLKDSYFILELLQQMIQQQEVEEVKGEMEIREKSLENWGNELSLAKESLAVQKEQLKLQLQQQQLLEQQKSHQEAEQQKHQHALALIARATKSKTNSIFDTVALVLAQNADKFQQLKPLLETTNNLKDEEFKEWVQDNMLTEGLKTKASALEPMASVALFTFASVSFFCKRLKFFVEQN